MNRPTPQQQRPLRDHIRVTPGTRNAAASLPREQEFDDPKLMTLLQSASKDMQGLRLVHLHLSQLENTELSDTAVILTDDDPYERMRRLKRANDAAVRLMGTEHLVIRLDLD